jgi:hypothetical protein
VDFLDEDFRPPPLRADFLPPRLAVFLPPREELRDAPERLRLERFLPPARPPLLRPEDPDRDLFLPPLRLLDFLAAAMGKLREGEFVEPIARFAHNSGGRLGGTAAATRRCRESYYRMLRVSPWRNIHSCSSFRPSARHTSRIFCGGSFMGSSVSLNVPQWAAATTIGLPVCARSS